MCQAFSCIVDIEKKVTWKFGVDWRPAVSRPRWIAPKSDAVQIHGGCWRICDYCELAQRLTQQEFYAQFGRMPW